MSERPEILMVRRGSFLQPAAPVDSVALEAYSAGKPLKVRITQPRSIQQNRLYWSMINLVCENVDQALTPDALHEWVKLRCGVTVQIQLKSGKVDTVPGSIAFDKMSQPEFRAFFDRAKDLLVEHVIPGLGRATLEREARLMLGEAV